MPFVAQKMKTEQKTKKKPPPRPPPPNFSKYKSKSYFNLDQQIDNLIEWSPPNSPKVERMHNFGGSVSSSFSSSTSSLASSKKSLEYDSPVTNNLWPTNLTSSSSINYNKQSNSTFFVPSEAILKEKFNNVVSCGMPSVIQENTTQSSTSNNKLNIPPIFGPTIIRAQNRNEFKTRLTKEDNATDPPSPQLPMPSIPPPSPPKDVKSVDIAYGIALYNYHTTNSSDLSFQAGDIVILVRRLNDEWYYGKVLDKEGMFPANFIEVQVPLLETESDNSTVMALYEFTPQMTSDLALRPGQLVKVVRKINDEWLYGESNGQCGEFPSNFVDRVPDL